MGNFCSMGASRKAKQEALEDGGIYEKKKPEDQTADAGQIETTKPSIVVSDEHSSKPVEESGGGFLGGATQLISNTGSQLKEMAEKEVEEKKKEVETKAEETKEAAVAKAEEVKETVVAKASEIGQSITGAVSGIKSSADEKVKEAGEATKSAEDSGKGIMSDLKTGLDDKVKSVDESVAEKKGEISTGIAAATTSVGKAAESAKETTEAQISSTKEAVDNKVQEAKDAAAAEAAAAKASAESQITSAKEGIEAEANKAAISVTETVDSAKDSAASKIDSAKEGIAAGIASVETQAAAVKDDAEKKVKEIKDEVSSKAESLKDEAVAKKEEVAASVSAAAANAQSSVESAVDAAKTKKEEIASDISTKKEEVKAGFSSSVDQVGSSVDSAKDSVLAEVTEAKSQVEIKVTEAQDSVEQLAEDASQKGEEMKAGAVSAAVGFSENVSAAKDAATDEVKAQSDSLQDSAKSTVKSAAGCIESSVDKVAEKVDQGVVEASSEASAVGDKVKEGLATTGQEAGAVAEAGVEGSGAKKVVAEGLDLLGEIDACTGGEVMDFSKEVDEHLGSADVSVTSGETQSDSLMGDVTPLTASETSQQTDSSIPSGSDTVTSPEVMVENRQEYANDVKPKQLAVTRNADNTVTTRDLASESVAMIPESPVTNPQKCSEQEEGSSVDFFSKCAETVKAGISDSTQKVTGFLGDAAAAVGLSKEGETEVKTNEAEATSAEEVDDETVKRIAAEVTAQAVQQALEVVAAEEANNNIENPETPASNPAEQEDGSSSVDVLNTANVTPSMAPNDTAIVNTPNQKNESAKSEVQFAGLNSSVDPPANVNGNAEEATKDSVVEKKDCSDCSTSQTTDVQKEAMI